LSLRVILSLDKW